MKSCTKTPKQHLTPAALAEALDPQTYLGSTQHFIDQVLKDAAQEAIKPFLDAPGFRLHYELEGDPANPALLLSNSLGADLAMWDFQMSALTPPLPRPALRHPGPRPERNARNPHHPRNARRRLPRAASFPVDPAGPRLRRVAGRAYCDVARPARRRLS